MANPTPSLWQRSAAAWRLLRGKTTEPKATEPTGQRMFAAAMATNTVADWMAHNSSIDTEVRSSLRKLLDRSRALERDNDYMRGFLGDCEDNIVGAIRKDLRVDAGEETFQSDGRPVWKPDRRANALIQAGWQEWGKLGSCTVCGQHSWRDVKKLAARGVPRDGNFLARKIRGKQAGNRFGFALQLWEIDHLELEKFETLSNGGEIRFGIEFDTFRRPVAYHLRVRHPGDYAGASQRTERVPAAEIYHVFVSERVGQSIGYPWVVSAITRLRQLGAFEEAAVVAARVGATQAGFFKKTPAPGGGVGSWTGDTDVAGNSVLDASPGSFQELPEGWDLASWNPKFPDIETGAFRKAMLMGVATGMRTSYISFANDLEAVNYSSARVGIYDERETWKSHQVFQDEKFNELVFADWLEAALMSGAIPLPLAKFAKFNRPVFKARRWGYIDPVKEMEAAQKGIALRLTSRRQIIDEAGGEVEDTFDDNLQDETLAEAIGLSLSPPDPMPEAFSDPTKAAGSAPDEQSAAEAKKAKPVDKAENK